MAKKRETRRKEKTSPTDMPCSIDGGYEIPVHSFRDLTAENIRNAVTSSRYIQLLLCLTVIGLALRLYQLGYNSLWLDEASTLAISVKSLPDIWQATTGGEFNPPLFYWIEHLMLTVGNSEAVLRVVPAILGTLTIPLVYGIGKEFMDRNVGIIAAAMAAFSPFLVYYSQEARAYALMLFLLAAAMLFYLRAMKGSGTGDWALFALFSALAFWAHFYALVMIGALVIYALYIQIPGIRKDPGRIRPLLASFGIFLLISLPLGIVTIQLFLKRTATAPTFGIPGPDLVLATFSQMSGSLPVLVLFMVLFIAGIIQAFLIDRNKGIFLLTLTVLPFIISVFLSYRIPMQPRYLIFLSIIYFVAIACTYTFFYNFFRSPRVVYGFILLMVAINGIQLAGYYSGYVKDDWRGFSSELRQLTRPGDIVVAVPLYLSQPLDYYYSNATDQTIELGAYTATDLSAIEAGRKNSTVYFVVTGDISSADPSGGAAAWLQQHARSLGSITGIYLFASP